MTARGTVTLGLFAGGAARRLGGLDKAWLERDGQPQVLRLAAALSAGTECMLISANGDATRYAAAGLHAVADRARLSGLGPMAGLDALLAACTTDWLFTAPVDLVDAPDHLLERLLEAAGATAAGHTGANVALAGSYAQDDDGVQPLVAVYRVAAVREAVAYALASGRLAPRALHVALGFAAARFTGARFGNLNTPADLVAAGIHAGAGATTNPQSARAMPDPHAYPTRIAYTEALALVQALAEARRLPIESLALARADGRILARDVAAPIALPPFDNSAMDGFAVRSEDLGGPGTVVLGLVAEQFAGLDQAHPLGRGECIRITTGAPLPPGADAIVVKENATVDGAHVGVPAGIRAGTHVRRAGEDVQAGDVVLQAGTVLTPSRIGLASALGLAQLPVSTRPTVAVFATGDELVEPGLDLAPGQVYNSNRALLMAQLRLMGLEPVAWPTLPDDPERIESLLLDAAASFDVVITCGGVSAGEKDHLPGLVRSRGAVHFWKVRMRPGMPILLGELPRPDGTHPSLLLALPGNPVSVLATFLVLGRELLDGLQGRREPRARLRARLSAPWTKSHERLEFLRGRLRCDDTGALWVTPNPADGSHRLRGAADSDALILLEEGARTSAQGDVVDVLPY